MVRRTESAITRSASGCSLLCGTSFMRSHGYGTKGPGGERMRVWRCRHRNGVVESVRLVITTVGVSCMSCIFSSTTVTVFPWSWASLSWIKYRFHLAVLFVLRNPHIFYNQAQVFGGDRLWSSLLLRNHDPFYRLLSSSELIGLSRAKDSM